MVLRLFICLFFNVCGFVESNFITLWIFGGLFFLVMLDSEVVFFGFSSLSS